jgi:hypothetical protein
VFLGIKRLLAFGDSKVVIEQVNKEWDCVKDMMDAYCAEIRKLEGHFEGIEFQHVPRNNNVAADVLSKLGSEGPIRRTREGESEWEPIKILLEGDGDSNKTNTASNTRLRLTTKVGQVHVATGVPLDLGTNTQPSEPKHTNTHSGNLHGLLPVLHQSDR